MRTEHDDYFINILNESYPFERYILKEPKPINSLFDDALLTEIFVPNTEIKPILSENGKLFKFTEVPINDIYVKIKGPAGTMRFAYFDFAEHIREEIRYNIILDFGQYEWECLYVNHEDDENEFKNALKLQKQLIEKNYGECKIKDGFHIDKSINIIENERFNS